MVYIIYAGFELYASYSKQRRRQCLAHVAGLWRGFNGIFWNKTNKERPTSLHIYNNLLLILKKNKADGE